MLSYGAHLVRTGQVAGPDLLAFVIYQLTLGGILSVGTMKYLKIVELFFFCSTGNFTNLYGIDVSCWRQSIGL